MKMHLLLLLATCGTLSNVHATYTAEQLAAFCSEFKDDNANSYVQKYLDRCPKAADRVCFFTRATEENAQIDLLIRESAEYVMYCDHPNDDAMDYWIALHCVGKRNKAKVDRGEYEPRQFSALELAVKLIDAP